MKRRINLFKRLGFIFFIFLTNYAHGQQTGCKVLLPAIAGSYFGKCKNGLAQGTGIAQGIDRYQGQFYKGLPQGRGTYTWANGSVFQGQWSDGLKEGKGKLVIPTSKGDSIITGHWKKDNYAGTQLFQPFKIERSLGVTRYGFHNISGQGKDVIIKIMIGGVVNQDIEEFSLAYDSGDEFKMGGSTGLQNVIFPLLVKVTYRTWNQLHTNQ